MYVLKNVIFLVGVKIYTNQQFNRKKNLFINNLLTCSIQITYKKFGVRKILVSSIQSSIASLEPMKALYQTILLVLTLFCVAFSIGAQKDEIFPTRQQSEFVNARPEYCWSDQLKLDGIKQHIPTDKTIIVIARLGDKDLKPNLNKKRLHNVRTYLTLGESYKHTEESIILAEGESIKGYGQVEFYLDGRLIEVIKARQNSVIAVPDCYGGIEGEPLCAGDSQKLFYPCKDYLEKQKQKRKVVRKKKKSR